MTSAGHGESVLIGLAGLTVSPMPDSERADPAADPRPADVRGKPSGQGAETEHINNDLRGLRP